MPSSSRPIVVPPRPRSQGKHALAAWVWILGFCLAALIATYVMFVEPPPPRKIVIASGSRNGAYFRYAQKYAEELQKEGLSVEVRETAGSVENLRLLGQDRLGRGGRHRSERRGQPRGGPALSCPGQPVPRALVGLLPRRQAARSPQPARGQTHRRRSGGQRYLRHRHAVARRQRPDRIRANPSRGNSRAVLVQENVAAAAKALQKGELDAAFFVAAFEADYIQGLLNDRRVNLLNFDQHEAYHRRFRFLAPVTVPAGMVNLGQNIPGQDVALLAPTAMLVVRKDFHPALVPLLLTTATRIHGKGDELSNPGEFPSESYCDFPVSEDAKHFYRSGQPVLQRLLPFWLASLVDRAKVMLIPLIMLMMPLLRAAPPLMRWRTRRKIYLWYSDLREIDQRLVAGLSGPELDQELARLKDIEHQVAYVDVPLSYMEEFYHLRLHLGMLQQRLVELRSRCEPIVSSSKP